MENRENIIENPVVPNSYKTTVTNYHLCRLTIGERAAEQIYRKRISGLTGWIQRKRPSYLSERFMDMCIEIACDEAEKFAKALYAKNPKLSTLDEWGVVE